MADQDFKINIKTTADTSGISEIERRMEFLRTRQARENEIAKAALEKARSEASKQVTPPVPTEKQGVGNLFGIDPNYEAIVRRIGLAFGALEVAFLNLLKNAYSEQQKVNEELSKTTEQVSKLTNAWHENAIAATSQEDIARIVHKSGTEIDALTSKISGSQKVTLGFNQTLAEAALKIINFTASFAGAGFPKQLIDDKQFSKGVEQVISFYKQLRQSEVEAAADAIELGKDLEKALNADKQRNVVDAINETTRSIAVMKDLMNGLNTRTAEGLKLWSDYNALVGQSEKRLQALSQRQTQQQNDLSKSQDNASAGVQGVLRNEEAARNARAAGQEKDADLYQKSADQIKAGLSETDAAQLDTIKKQQDALKPTQPGGRKAEVGESQDLVDQIERNRKAFEAGEGGQDFSQLAGQKTKYDPRAAEIERQTQNANTERDTDKGHQERHDALLDYLKSVWGNG